ncbi:MAG: fused MFS/spermidine synthase [Chloroflexi bacterium]|nr:fused MFS/spermidine synthase [Chloroflexota bacterium]
MRRMPTTIRWYATVFIAGAATLGIEMAASRLLAPYFGTSQPVWAAIIGLTLLAMALGAHLGGRLAARHDERALAVVLALGGVATAAIPPLAAPILQLAQGAIGALAVGGFVGALLGVLLLFAVPIILLSMAGPLAVHHLTREPAASAARVAGSVSAIATIGSIGGTFATVLWLIPGIGTSRTLQCFALVLVLLGAANALGRARAGMLALVLLPIGAALLPGSTRAAACIGCTTIAERESAYNAIQVARRTHPIHGPQTVLLLNEGYAVHSYANDRGVLSGDAREMLSGGPWDYFAVAPYMVRDRAPAQITRLAMLGAAAGTVPAQFLAIYGADTVIDAVEIDPAIIAVSREYFNVRDAAVPGGAPSYHIHADDARAWLARATQDYDVIGMDAYHQPYIPFHLTTVEFFREVRSRLAPDGVAVVNAGLGPNGDDRLSRALATTMARVFPQVYVIDTAQGGNQILVGTLARDDDGLQAFVANYLRIGDPALRMIMETVVARRFVDDGAFEPFTDDLAPVEALVDSLIFSVIDGAR